MRFLNGVLPQFFLFVVFCGIASLQYVESSGDNSPVAKVGHSGMSCPTQWRDHIVVERIVFDNGGDDGGEKDIAYVPMAFMPRQGIDTWLAVIDKLPSYSIPNHISVHVLSVVIYQYGWDWDDGPTEYTPEGRPMGTSSTLALRVNFDDYIDVLERVRVIVFPFMLMLTDSSVDMAFAVGGVTPPPPSPPFGFILSIGALEYNVRECVTGDFIFWCDDCQNYCPAADPRPPKRLHTSPATHDNYLDILGICTVKLIPHFKVQSIEFVCTAGCITSFTTANLAPLQRASTLPTHVRLSLASYWKMKSVNLLLKASTHCCSIITRAPYLGVMSTPMARTSFSGTISWRRKSNLNPSANLSHPRWISTNGNLSCRWILDGESEGHLAVAAKSELSFNVEVLGGYTTRL